jgi:hypothetical protein
MHGRSTGGRHGYKIAQEHPRDYDGFFRVVGHDGVTGTNTSASCVNLAEAEGINKIWYGQTADGMALMQRPKEASRCGARR